MSRKDTQGLTEQQQQAVLLVASGGTNAAIGEAVGISEWTVSRWRQEPAFQAAVNAVLADARAAARERLRSLVSVALDTLERSLDDPEIPPSQRLQAAFKVLELVNLEPGAPIGSTDPATLDLQRRLSVI